MYMYLKVKNKLYWSDCYNVGVRSFNKYINVKFWLEEIIFINFVIFFWIFGVVLLFDLI